MGVCAWQRHLLLAGACLSWWSACSGNVTEDSLDKIYGSLESAVMTEDAQSQLNRELNIAVGVNAAVDLIVSGTALFKALGIQPPDEAVLHESLRTADDAAVSFAYAFSTGTGSERPFVDGTEYARIVEVAKTLKDKEYFTGGNAALIGQHLVETSGARPRQVALVSSVGPMLADLLHDDIRVPASSKSDKDEIHLILEFKLGEQWGSYTAKRANRFIFSYDRTNAMMLPMADYPSAIKEFDPSVLVVTGIHMVEAEASDYRLQRVNDCGAFFDTISSDKAIHLELASLGDNDFVKAIAENMISRVDSLGLNEQELKLIATVADGPHQAILEGPFENPSVAVIADLVHWVLQRFGSSENARLSRVHFHTLGFHVIGMYKGHWGDPSAAVAWGAATCSQRACRITDRKRAGESLEGIVTHRMPEMFSLHNSEKQDTDPDLESLTVSRNFDPSHAVVSWERGDMVFAMSPVLVCTPPEKTVGLGDSISAAGLEMHEFIKSRNFDHRGEL